jgi:hypothetical protein
MSDIDYKQVICLMVSDGLVTVDQVMSCVDRLIVVDTDKYDTPTWIASRRIIKIFNEKLKANAKKPSVVNISALSSIEKLLRIDKHTEEEVIEMIEWCTSDEFWHTVILSTTKLRKHFETMKQRRLGNFAKPAVVQEARPKIVYADAEWEADMEKRRKESIAKPSGMDLKKALKGKR